MAQSDYSQYVKSYAYPVYGPDDPWHEHFSDLDTFIEVFRWKDTDTYLLRRDGGDFMWDKEAQAWAWPNRETLHANKERFLFEGLDAAFEQVYTVASLHRAKMRPRLQQALQERRREEGNV